MISNVLNVTMFSSRGILYFILSMLVIRFEYFKLLSVGVWISNAQDISLKPDLIIKPDLEEGFRFTKEGQMIGSLGYYHLLFDVNITYIEEAIAVLCSHSDITLEHYRQRAGNDKGVKVVEQLQKEEDGRCADLTADYLNVLNLLNTAPDNGKFEEPHIPFQHLNDTLGHYVNTKKFQLSNEYDFSKKKTKKRRQIVAGILILLGIVAIGTILYSQTQLASISVSSDRDANLFAVKKLQEVEVRSKINKKMLDGIVANLHTLSDKIARLEMASALFRMTMTNDRVEKEIRRMINNIETIASLRLAPRLLRTYQLEERLGEIQKRLNQQSYQLATVQLRDILHIPVSYLLFKDGKLRIFIHLPMYRVGTILDVWRFQNVPFSTIAQPSTAESKIMMRLQVENPIIAVDRTGTMVKVFSDRQLQQCQRAGSLYYCVRENTYDKTFQKTCVYALFARSTRLVKKNCHYDIIPAQPIVLQLNSTNFLTYQGVNVSAELRCIEKPDQRVIFSGQVLLHISEGCRLITPAAVLDSTMNVWGNPVSVLKHDFKLEELLNSNEWDVLMNADSYLVNLDRNKLKQGIPLTDIIDGYNQRLTTTYISIVFASVLCLVVITVLVIIWRRLVHLQKRRRQIRDQEGAVAGAAAAVAAVAAVGGNVANQNVAEEHELAQLNPAPN